MGGGRGRGGLLPWGQARRERKLGSFLCGAQGSFLGCLAMPHTRHHSQEPSSHGLGAAARDLEVSRAGLPPPGLDRSFLQLSCRWYWHPPRWCLLLGLYRCPSSPALRPSLPCLRSWHRSWVLSPCPSLNLGSWFATSGSHRVAGTGPAPDGSSMGTLGSLGCCCPWAARPSLIWAASLREESSRAMTTGSAGCDQCDPRKQLPVGDPSDPVS